MRQNLGNMKPTLIVAYGEQDRIGVAASRDLLGMSLTNLVSGNLLGIAGGAIPFNQFQGAWEHGEGELARARHRLTGLVLFQLPRRTYGQRRLVSKPASIASSYHDQSARVRNIFILRRGTKDMSYSCRRAASGSIRDARLAGA